jgi:acyl-CoA synthetase (AMP-forming)/AMP-acid ligase II
MNSTDKFLPHQRLPGSFHIDHPNVGALLASQAQAAPAKTFLICPGSAREEYTYAEFHELMTKTACFLQSRGLKKGDRINLIIPNCAEFLLLYFAALPLGITVVPINEDLAPKEMSFIINDSGSRIVFYDPGYQHKVSEFKSLIPATTETCDVGRYPDFLPLIQAPDTALVPADVELTDIGIIIYTSGTTGNPKGVVLAHMSMLADAKALSERLSFSAKTRTMTILPMFHNNGQIVTLMTPLYAGGSVVLTKGKVSLMSFWGLIQKYEVSWTSVMPAILSILLSLKSERKDQSLEGIICGGQPLTKAVQQSFEDRFKVPVFEGYGLTESTAYASFSDHPAEKRKPGSIGRALPCNQMAVLDENGNEVPHGTEGEICMRGLNVANEYLGLPDRNRTSFANGWFHSGDFGHMDADGYFYFGSRKDHMIIRGGENIYPAELENVIFEHPAVAEVAVIGVPDKLLGEAIVAFVKLHDDAQATPQELASFCTGKIALFKQAREIYIIDHLPNIDALPKGPTKKVLYRELKDYYQTKLPPECNHPSKP